MAVNFACCCIHSGVILGIPRDVMDISLAPAPPVVLSIPLSISGLSTSLSHVNTQESDCIPVWCRKDVGMHARGKKGNSIQDSDIFCILTSRSGRP